MKLTESQIRVKTEKDVYKKIINGVINAETSKDLKNVLNELKECDIKDHGRSCFLYGLLQGTLMQFNKEESIKELKEIFYNL